MNEYNAALHPDQRDTWVFDLDNTLYPAECDLFSQIDRNIGTYVADLLKLSPADARKVQKGYLLEHGTTLKGLMVNYAVDPHHYLAAVHDIDFSPIQPDPHLKAAIDRLPGKKYVFTNADRPYAEEVLTRLGLGDTFNGLFDIHDAELHPKPVIETYHRFLKDHGVNPARAVMFEDMARNLIPAHALGMGTVWIDTGSPWSRADHDPALIHAETDGLTSWLDAYSRAVEKHHS